MKDNTMQNRVRTVRHLIESGGGTMDEDGYKIEFDSGYMVGVVTFVHIFKITDEMLEKCISLSNDGMLGVWVNKDKSVYLEKVENIESLELAMRKAKMRGEVAIWDCENNVAIEL